MLIGLLAVASGCSLGDASRPPEITSGGGDVWGWSATVEGTAECDRVRLAGGAEPADASTTDGRFAGEVRLRPGENQITAACLDGDEPSGDASSPVALRVPLADRPTARIDVSLDGDTVVFEDVSQPSEASGADLTGEAWTARETNPAPLTFEGSGRRVTARAPAADGEYYVRLSVEDARGNTDESTTYFVVEDGRPRIPDFDREHPTWVDDAIIYGVAPAFFGSQPLRAVTGRLDYLKRLGVNTLWLGPTYPAPPGDYGYAVTDYFGVREDFGTEEDLRRLVDEAHRRGMRVLLDFVPNHTSEEHPYALDMRRQKERSRYWHYYDRDEEGAGGENTEMTEDADRVSRADGGYTYYFDWTYLPNLNYANPEVRRFMTEAFSYWVREFDVDGFRVDAVWGVRQRAPDYFPGWRRELKRIKPDLLLLAEGSARDPFYVNNGFDAAYDWTERVGQAAWQDAFIDEPTIALSIVEAVENRFREPYDPDSLVMHFLNTNDSEVRFVAQYGPDLTRAAAAILLTIPGIPELFTGDEIGANFSPYGNRTPIVWEDTFNLRPTYERLIAIRNAYPALRSRTWDVLDDGEESGVLAFVRSGRGGEPVLVVVNPVGRSTTVSFRVPERYGALAADGTLRDLVTERPVDVGGAGELTVEMGPYDYKIMVGR